MSNSIFDWPASLKRFVRFTSAKAEEVNDALDDLSAGLDTVEANIARAVKLPIGTADQTLALAAGQRAGLLLGFDPSGNIAGIAGGGRWRGDWSAGTQYVISDYFIDPVSKSIYACLEQHTSASIAADLAAGKVRLAIDVAAVEGQRILAQQAAVAADQSNTLSSQNASASAASAAMASADASSASASAIAASKLNLGDKATEPTVDNQGGALRAGATYYNTTTNKWRVWTGSAWGDGVSAAGNLVSKSGDTMIGQLTLVDQALPITTNNLPTLRPSLLLDFANGRSVDPRITFTRSSTATRTNEKGLIETVAANVPRIDFDPVTGECKGLLGEEQCTNLVTYSEQFDNAAWGKMSGATITANTATAPDGTLTADTLTSDGAGPYIDHPALSLTNGQKYAVSFYAKAGTASAVLAIFYGANFNAGGANISPNFDLASGVVVSAGGAENAQIQSVGNGWYRCSFVVTLTAATGTYVNQLIRATAAGTLFVWGAQIEAGSHPTSYIPTAGAAATRAADVAVMTGSNFSSWYRQDEGTFLAVAKLNRESSYPVGIASISDGSSNNSSVIFYRGSGTVGVYVLKAGVSQADLSPTPVIPANAEVVVGYAYKENDFAASWNGESAVFDTSGSVPQSINSLSLGVSTLSGGILNGHIRRIAYYPKRLTNAELQALTTR